jgi:hypothetical protein
MYYAVDRARHEQDYRRTGHGTRTPESRRPMSANSIPASRAPLSPYYRILLQQIAFQRIASRRGIPSL